MDPNKLKKELADRGAEKGKEELEKLKGGFEAQKGQSRNASTTPAQTGEPRVGPATDHYSGQLANSGHTGTTPEMKQEPGKRDIREPETPAREEEIREPNPDEQEAAAQAREESRKAAVEENPARDDEGGKEAA